MKKFTPREKLSKKAKASLDRKNRNTWGAINPVTRKKENLKAYNRKKVQKGDDVYLTFEPFLMPSNINSFHINNTVYSG